MWPTFLLITVLLFPKFNCKENLQKLIPCLLQIIKDKTQTEQGVLLISISPQETSRMEMILAQHLFNYHEKSIVKSVSLSTNKKTTTSLKELEISSISRLLKRVPNKSKLESTKGEYSGIFNFEYYRHMYISKLLKRKISEGNMSSIANEMTLSQLTSPENNILLNKIRIATNYMLEPLHMLLKDVHNMQRWVVLLADARTTNFSLWSRDRYPVKVSHTVMLPGAGTLNDQLQELRQHPAWNSSSQFLVAELPGLAGTRNTLQTLLSHHVTDILVLTLHGESINLTSWWPYRTPDHCGGPVRQQDLILLDQWRSNGMFMWGANLFPSKVSKNLHGCTIITTAYLLQPFIVRQDGAHSKNEAVDLGGLEINILQEIAKRTNFIVKFLISEWIEVADAVNTGLTDVGIGLQMAHDDIYNLTNLELTVAYLRNPTYWYVPSDSVLPQWMSLGLVFEQPLWMAIISSYTCVSITLWILSVLEYKLSFMHCDCSPHLQKNIQLSRYFMTVLLMLLCSSISTLPKCSRHRVIFSLWLLCFFILNSLYQSTMTSFLINRSFYQSIKTLNDIIESQISIASMYGYIPTLSQIDDIRYKYVVRVYQNCTNFNECLDRVAFARDTAFVSDSLIVEYEISRKYMVEGRSLIKQLDETIQTFDTLMYVSKRSMLLERFNYVIQQLIEMGVTQKWWKDCLFSPDSRSGLENDSINGGPVSITVSHLQGAFYLLLLGLFIATGLFTFEKLKYYKGTSA